MFFSIETVTLARLNLKFTTSKTHKIVKSCHSRVCQIDSSERMPANQPDDLGMPSLGCRHERSEPVFTAAIGIGAVAHRQCHSFMIATFCCCVKSSLGCSDGFKNSWNTSFVQRMPTMLLRRRGGSSEANRLMLNMTTVALFLKVVPDVVSRALLVAASGRASGESYSTRRSMDCCVSRTPLAC